MAIKLTLSGVAILITLLYIYSRRQGAKQLSSDILLGFSGYAILNIGFIIFLWFNHINFPLNLEAMELTGLQHLKRILTGLPLYPPPTADFVALAYNPLYYYLCAPFTWLLGPQLSTMRLVAILGMLGSGLLVFYIVRQETRSLWWGLTATGLFAAAYGVMDSYLDNAHRDSWLLLVILLGAALIDQHRSQTATIGGILLLISGFWLKQQGAIFTAAGLGYLTWRNGWYKTQWHWVSVLLLGIGLYCWAPDELFGSHFHYYTWTVPRQWTEFSSWEIRHFIAYLLPFLILGVSGGITTVKMLRRGSSISIWYFMFPVALLSGILAIMTPGSNNNVFIPMSVWIIIVGTIGLKQLIEQYTTLDHLGFHVLAIGLSYALFFYNPLALIVSPQAHRSYQDLIGFLKSLDPAVVYAPRIGQLQNGYQFYPAVHWVPLNDIVRRPDINIRNHPTARAILDPVIHPKQQAYILNSSPIEEDDFLAFLLNDYVLERDLGDRFQALSALPKRYSFGYPRYLYRFSLSSQVQG